MMFSAIEAERANIPISRSCALFGVSESGFHAWRKRRPSARQLEDMVLLAHIRSQYATSHETYGSPRMTVELKEDGLVSGASSCRSPDA
jgi:putative transposase